MSIFAFDAISPVLIQYLVRFGFDSESRISLAGTAGSGRMYYRIQTQEQSLGLLVSPPGDADFGRFLRITQFYRMAQFPVPRVHCIDDTTHQVLLEDLGNRRLYDLLQSDRASGLAGYRKALDLLADLQTRCHALHEECPDICSRIFDREHLLWETSYYRTHYLEGHRELQVEGGLQKIFDDLAASVDQHPKAILHRDFQSQNLMVKADGSVHVIDYQGSRLGSIYYDLASLLLDPYVMLSDAEIEDLLRYFHVKSHSPLNFNSFREAFLHAGLQRVMQALGAYCFLSRIKGLAPFAAHIQPGEKRLRWLLRETEKQKWDSIIP